MRLTRQEGSGWWRVGRLVAEPLFRSAFRVRLVDTENIPKSGGAILAANHISVLDPIFVALSALQRGRVVRFLALEELFDQPVVGWALRRLHQVPLRRGAGDWGAINELARLLRAGMLTGISPEGTVGDGVSMLPGQKGVARIALASGVPVVPIGLWGSQERWPKSGLTLRGPIRPTVVLVVGKPIPASGDPTSPGDVRALRDRVMNSIQALAGQARDATTSSRAAVGRPHPESSDPHPRAPVGAQSSAKRDPFRALMALAERHGDVAPYRSGREEAFLVNHPDLVRHVLADNAANYQKDTFINRQFKVAVADGLLTSEGVVWRRDRRLMQPAFHRDRLASLANSIVAEVATVRDRWDEIAGSGRAVDMTAEMGTLTLRITAAVLFGADISTSAQRVGQLISDGMAHMLSFGNSQGFRAAKQRVEVLADDVIERRRTAAPTGSSDLLSMLLEARDEETGEGMSARQLRDQVITLLVAGYETTANALSWTWYLLSQNPEAMGRLQDEASSVLDGGTPDSGTLRQLPQTRMVVEEALRLYPPAWILGRRALSEDRLGDRTLPAGSVVAISPYVLHRHPSFWEDPERFDPSRFTPELVAARHRFSYVPFGAGPRLCIGHNLAMLEAQLALATLVQGFAPRLVPGTVVVPERRFTLRPRGGLPMTIHTSE